MKNTESKHSRKILVFQIAVNIAVIFAMLFITEITLRYFSDMAEPGEFTPHPTLYWKLTPNLKNYDYKMGNLSSMIDTNTDGFRNEKLDVARNERSFRILCLGDETTFGTGVKQSETFAKVLQLKLRKRYHFYMTEGINAGVEGYTTYQGLRFLEEYCLKYKPDIIVVGFLHNDMSFSSRADKDRISTNPMAVKLKRNLYKLQSFMTLRNFLLGKLYERVQKEQDSGTVQRVSPANYRKNLEEISRLASTINAKLIFLNLPEDKEIHELPAYRLNLKKVAEKSGVLIDLNADFQIKPNLYIPGTRVPSKEGHEAIGEKLFSVIQSNSLMPQRPGGKEGVEKPGVPPPLERKPGEAPPPGGQKVKQPVPGQPAPGGAPPQGGPGKPPGADNFYF